MSVHRFQTIPELSGKTIRAAAFVIREDTTHRRPTTAELDLIFTDGSSATIQCSGPGVEVSVTTKEGK